MAKEKETPVFTKGELISNASVFGVKPEIMAGALFNVTKPVTKEKAEELLIKFKTRRVK